MDFSNGLISFCEKHDNISVYGIGNYGMMTKTVLYGCNMTIHAFVISDNQQFECENIDQVKVFKFSEWIKEHGDDSVIVAVAEPSQNEICIQLKRAGIDSFYCVKESDIYQRPIGILDTSIAVENHGNEIIMQAVNQNLEYLFKEQFIFRLPFIDEFRGYAVKYLGRCEKVFLGGTNALNSSMDIERFIGVSSKNITQIRNKLILMGVGWCQYEEEPNEYSIELLRQILSKDKVHSVRDSYTEKKLKSIGITNVVNTGCPTLWNMNEEFCMKIPCQKGRDAIIMLTPGDRKRDEKIVNIVVANYEKIFFWPQGPIDYSYIKSICPNAEAISPQLNELDNFLDTHNNIDYIGTRLHGGIRCLQHKKRAIILSVDNRAAEMGKDFNLPVLDAGDMEQLQDKINGVIEIDIRLPKKNIDIWKNQFKNRDI